MDTRSKPSTAENPTRLHSPALSAAVESFRALDHAKEAMTARMTRGLSPASLRAALADWLIHLAAAPGKQLEVTALGAQNALRITEYLFRTALGWYAQPLAEGSAADSRFLTEPWQTEPYRFRQQAFLLAEQWWNAATRDVPGLTRHHEAVDGRPISIRNIRAPLFVLATERGHIAPWHSVYKIHSLSDTEITFVLSSGGRNAGIVSGPGHAHRHFRMYRTWADDLRVSPDEWLAATTSPEGSWWLASTDWHKAHSSATRVVPSVAGSDPREGAPADAPGSYVLQH
ncbi:poly-beta-hydroxybutyrate polymerase N-terminal domain-containing protein [Caballeronia grimmiae]|uniref:poly-beta-hydroxybutyrate polymerase N-terminal domain-containing protein n=1 Tax=Caballeronia grimmiae TaxID=1071679 RepID=UPI0038BC3E56